ARRYFDLAWSYAIKPSRPTLFITAGLIGTGKSTLAEGLAREMGLAVLSSDVVRKKLARLGPTERRYEHFEAGIYSQEFTRKTYDELFRQAKELLSKGESVVLDASFRKAEQRQEARALAIEQGADFRVLECVSDEAGVKQRLADRQRRGNSVSDGRLEILADIKGDFEALTDVPGPEHIVVDTSGEIENTISQAIKKIVAGVE
ncbi:MAG: AAA family ATPase, partial [Dehalococcoidia bacterium]|nr:AAA family ATPase [Dehalococcoidia bacterium]